MFFEHLNIFFFSFWHVFVEDDGLTDSSSLHHPLGVNLPADHQDTPEGQESIKAKLNAIRNKLVQQVRRDDLPDWQMIQYNMPSSH